jgi:hypothetical protein
MLSLLNDPVLMFVTIMGFTAFAFPHWKLVLGLSTVYGMFAISMKHDPVAGDGASFVASTADSVALAVDATFAYVLLFSLAPFLKTLLPPDVARWSDAIKPALPMAALLVAKQLIERQLVESLADYGRHVFQMAKDGIEQFSRR